MFDFLWRKRIAKIIPAVETYVKETLETPKEKQDNEIRYSIKVDLSDTKTQKHEKPEQKIQYSDRFSPDDTSSLIRRALLLGIPLDSTFLASHINDSFSAKVAEYIAQKSLRDSTVYKAAEMDRRLFSKLMTDPKRRPSKDSAIAIAVALRLSETEAKDLLERAGYALSHSDRRDVIIEYCFKNQVSKLPEVNAILETLGEKSIGR